MSSFGPVLPGFGPLGGSERSWMLSTGAPSGEARSLSEKQVKVDKDLRRAAAERFFVFRGIPHFVPGGEIRKSLLEFGLILGQPPSETVNKDLPPPSCSDATSPFTCVRRLIPHPKALPAHNAASRRGGIGPS